MLRGDGLRLATDVYLWLLWVTVLEDVYQKDLWSTKKLLVLLGHKGEEVCGSHWMCSFEVVGKNWRSGLEEVAFEAQ